MLEGEYLEMVNQLKSEFDKKEAELNVIKERNTDLLKIFISCYGFIRVIDSVGDPLEKDGMLEIMRGYLSDRFDEIMFVNSIDE
jgi:hypothetical protein